MTISLFGTAKSKFRIQEQDRKSLRRLYRFWRIDGMSRQAAKFCVHDVISQMRLEYR